MPYVVLTYDLHGASSTVYSKLNEELKKNNYKKMSEDTTWEAKYKDDVSVSGAISTTKNEFAACAKTAGASKYDLRIYAAPNDKMEFESVKK